MPLEIVGGFIQFVTENLVDTSGDPISVNAWDGEIPRTDQNGNPINPNVGSPNWPAVCIDMTDGGFQRTQRVGHPSYRDEGDIEIRVWGTGRAQVMAMLSPIEALLEQVTNQNAIPLTGGVQGSNPYVTVALMVDWGCKQQVDVRLAQSQLCYLGWLRYRCDVHGALSST